ncbi:MAG: hypothetical protein OEL57_00735 [Trichlorobacter sp.]|uniref:hypothetical protein n=1 Tax=Trichlorobacter sp. TaxID=2911007 RepID=UPI00255F1750|nr:hypothetical protein [Trichlorobacter sp.]MDK9716415.1 hypothetical protein [Trichlorobacter sp.]
MTSAQANPYYLAMLQKRIRIFSTTLMSILALATILMAPVAALSHQQDMPKVVSSAAAAATDCDDCHHDTTDTQQDDCCTSSACACACHAPLSLKAITVPLPVMVTSIFTALEPQQPPQVYLSIFVPPQNLS